MPPLREVFRLFLVGAGTTAFLLIFVDAINADFDLAPPILNLLLVVCIIGVVASRK